MDSQLTLINPEPHLELVLERPSTHLNTRLLVNGRARYKISTVDRDANITKVTDARTNRVIATIRKSLRVEEWMKQIKLHNGHEGYVISSESGRFMWRWDRALRMVLTPEKDTDQTLAFVKDEYPIFALCVKRSAEGSLDEIIPSFIILEHRLRMGTKSLRVADGWGAGNRSNALGTPLS
ncbi:hypothetical protein MD484_g5160, partial [Candolleomyces efflorescens]